MQPDHKPILVPTLSELGIELERLQAASIRAWNDISGQMGSPEHDISCDAAVAASCEVDSTIEAIAELPAASMADLRVKARALHVLDQTTEALTAPEDVDRKLIRQLIAGLLDERIM